jgi:hypothetical protein
MSDPQPPRTPSPVERLGTTTRHRSYLDSLPPIRSGKQMYGVNGEIQPYSVILRVLKTMDCYEITSTEDPIESPAKKQKIVDEISTPFPNLTDITIVTFNGKKYNIYGYSYYEYLYLSEKSKQNFLELVDLSETKLNIYTTKLRLSTLTRKVNYNKDDLLDFITQNQSEITLDDIAADDLKVTKAESDDEKQQLNNYYIPIFFELWICANFKCPGCGGKLVKYVSSIHPLVDVRCNNEDHTIEDGIKYFQIKVTNADSGYRAKIEDKEYLYFNYEDDNNYIHVGSVNYGFNSHRVYTNDTIETKELLIGYICIKYRRTGINTVTILPNESFITLPNKSLSMPSIYYYKYIAIKGSILTKSSHNYITFNPESVTALRFSDPRVSRLYSNVNSLNLKMKFTQTNINTDRQREFLKRLKLKYLLLKLKLN